MGLKIFSKKNNRKKRILDPEQAFIDTKNLSSFDADKFEGVLEKPLDATSLRLILGGVVVVFLFFIIISWNLQITNGQTYREKSDNNYIKQEVLFSDRGVIFDRNDVPLAWNADEDDSEFSNRIYTEQTGLSHLLGFLSYPQKDKSGQYFEKEYVGKAGVEKHFNNQLNGKLGSRILKVDATDNIFSNNLISLPEAGENLTLTIDSRLQTKLHQVLQGYLDRYKFEGGAGVIMDVNNGEIIAMTSVPEYDPNILTAGKDQEKISEYNRDPQHPFLNKAVYGEFVPGSVMKPFIALAALQEGVVTPYQNVYTNGKLVIPNPWYPSLPSIFMDNKNHGTINLFTAIAQSSNVYFYKVGGGFEDFKGLGIDKIYAYLTNFGFGEKTGIEGFPEKTGNVPNREWKEEIFNQQWLIGDTYYTSIGQYGFLVTPMQLAVGGAFIANGGDLVQPQITLPDDTEKTLIKETDFISEKNFATVRQAMRATVTRGTTQSLNFPFVKIASKSGTAETKGNTRLNSWVMGFWPYENPKYVFVLLAEDGPEENRVGVSIAASEFFSWMNTNGLQEYFK